MEDFFSRHRPLGRVLPAVRDHRQRCHGYHLRLLQARDQTAIPVGIFKIDRLVWRFCGLSQVLQLAN